MRNQGSPENRIACSDLVHHYADAVCRRDEDQWSNTWAPDAVWELGKGRRVEGREAIVELWNNAMDGFKAVVQNVVNHGANIDDESGAGIGRCYIQESWWRADDSRGILLGYYDDLYTLDKDEWRFASRELVVLYGGPPDLSAPFQNAWS